MGINDLMVEATSLSIEFEAGKAGWRPGGNAGRRVPAPRPALH